MPGARVLHLIDGLNVGGAEMLLQELSLGLAQRGFQVHIGYSTPGPLAPELNALGLPLSHLPRRMRIDPILFGRMVHLIRKVSPQVVHTHLFKSDFHGRIAARVAGVPVVVSTLHSTDNWAKLRPLGRLYGWTARFADCLIAVSEDVRKFHADYTGVPNDQFVTIENGVNLQRFTGQESAGDAVRRELGLDASTVIFGIVGRLTPPKDHATFIKAASLIRQQMPHAHFLVVGEGPLRERLEAQAQELGLSSAITFTGLRKDIPAVLAVLDVLVFSSLWEGLPVTLLEGMASSKPIVATAVGGIPDAVIPGKSALLVDPSDASAFASACLQVASDAEMRRSMGQLNLERVRAQYSMDKMIDSTAGLYSKLLQKHGLGRFVPSQVTG